MGQHIADDIHGVDGERPVFDANVHVHAKNEQAAGQHLHLFQHSEIAGIGRHRLVEPLAKRVRGGRQNFYTLAVGQIDNKLVT